MDKKSLAEILDALGNEHSLNIMAVLAGGECYVSELAKIVGISRPLLYLHLKKLENAGLVESEIRHFEEPPYTKKFYKAKNFELILSLSKTNILPTEKPSVKDKYFKVDFKVYD